MILASAADARLSPLTLFMALPMVPIANKPLMEHSVDLLARHGIKEIAVSLHSQAAQIERHFGDGRRWGVRLTYSLERELSGSGGAIRRLGSFFDRPFFVLPGGALTDLDLGAMLALHRERKALATLALKAVENPSRQAVARMSHDGRIRAFMPSGSAEAAEAGGEWLAYLDVGLFEPDILEWIPAGRPFDLGRDLYPALIEAEAPMVGYCSNCYWNGLENFAEYRRANSAVLQGEVQGALVPAGRAGEAVWMGRNISIHPLARIVPPLLIGDNCQVGARAVLGPDVILGNNVIADEGATVAGSVVLENTYVGRLVNVQEAVVNRNCLISVPADASVFVADRFMLGEVGEAALVRGLGRWAGRLAALLLLALSIPLWPLAVALALLAGRGPLITREERVTSDAGSEWLSGQSGWRIVAVPVFRADPGRLAGRLLRRSGLAGLPRLLAVVTGDLALVGVGPLRPDQLDQLADEWQRQRFLAPSGLTGLWYINESRLGSMSLQEQLIMDSYYAVTQSAQEKWRILRKTPAAWWKRLRSGGA
jgi:NDP-sugar pyrophosphorylase family protein